MLCLRITLTDTVCPAPPLQEVNSKPLITNLPPLTLIGSNSIAWYVRLVLRDKLKVSFPIYPVKCGFAIVLKCFRFLLYSTWNSLIAFCLIATNNSHTPPFSQSAAELVNVNGILSGLAMYKPDLLSFTVAKLVGLELSQQLQGELLRPTIFSRHPIIMEYRKQVLRFLYC